MPFVLVCSSCREFAEESLLWIARCRELSQSKVASEAENKRVDKLARKQDERVDQTMGKAYNYLIIYKLFVLGRWQRSPRSVMMAVYLTQHDSEHESSMQIAQIILH